MITRAEFHPTHDSQLVYSSSKGLVRLCDLRENARWPERVVGWGRAGQRAGGWRWRQDH